MPSTYDVAAVGNAIVDVLSPASEAFLQAEGLAKGAMTLIDTTRAAALYEPHGGGRRGVRWLGGLTPPRGWRASADVRRSSARSPTMRSARCSATTSPPLACTFTPSPLKGGDATGRCLVNVTEDGQRTMCTYLGAANALTPDDVDPELIASSEILYLEGYLFDPPDARAAFAKAATAARKAGRRVALSLSDAFVVERHRDDLLTFIASDTDILFANEAEVTALFPDTSFDAAVKALAGKVATAAVTRGAWGSTLVIGGSATPVPAAPVDKVIDTTGAGDQYAAGVLYGLARGLAPLACGRLGALAAAEVISHYGPRPQTPLKALAQAAGLI